MKTPAALPLLSDPPSLPDRRIRRHGSPPTAHTPGPETAVKPLITLATRQGPLPTAHAVDIARACSSLADHARLAAFTIIRNSPGGVDPEALAERLTLPVDVLRGHLAILVRSELIVETHGHRFATNLASVDRLAAFLEDRPI